MSIKYSFNDSPNPKLKSLRVKGGPILTAFYIDVNGYVRLFDPTYRLDDPIVDIKDGILGFFNPGSMIDDGIIKVSHEGEVHVISYKNDKSMEEYQQIVDDIVKMANGVKH